MRLLRAEQQLHEGQLEERFDVAEHASARRPARKQALPCCARLTRGWW
jgi:hypothetical protein